MKKDIAIIASVDFELSLIAAYLGAEKLKFHEPIKKDNIILCLSGIGMVNAAIASTRIMELYSPSMIISTGVCGACKDSGLDIGDIALAETEIYGDTGVVMNGDLQDLKTLGLPVIRRSSMEIFNEIPIMNSYKEAIADICNSLGLKLRCGRFVTVAGITGNPEMAQSIQRRWDAICENMEGAAVAHVALLNKIEFMEIRGVSNMAGDRDKSRWDLRLAAENCQRVLCRFIDEHGKDI